MASSASFHSQTAAPTFQTTDSAPFFTTAVSNGAQQPTTEQVVAEVKAMMGSKLKPEQIEAMKRTPLQKLLEIRNQMRATMASNKLQQQQRAGVPGPNSPQVLVIVKQIQDFNNANGIPFEASPQIEGRPVNLGLLFVWVAQRQGSEVITRDDKWGEALAAMGFPSDAPPTQPGMAPIYSDMHKRAIADLYSRFLGLWEKHARQRAETSKAAQAAAASSNAATTSAPTFSSPMVSTTLQASQVLSALKSTQLNKGKAPAVAEPEPEVEPEPKKRKRQRVEYVPVNRPMDTHGGWNVQELDQGAQRIELQRRHRAYADLGVVDLYSLTMSLRSRIPSELSYALNTLKLLADHTLTGQVQFRFKEAGDLLDELVDLLQDTAFAAAGDSPPPTNKRSKAMHAALSTYDRHVSACTESCLELKAPTRKTMPREALARSDTLLSVVTFFRMLASSTHENQHEMSEHPLLIGLLLRMCALGDQAGDDMGWLSAIDLLVIRKDVLFILAELGMRLRISTPIVAAAAFALLRFFIGEPTHSAHADQHYASVALATLAKIFITDNNRELLSRAHIRPVELFEQLVRSLPLSEVEYQAHMQLDGLTMLQLTVLAMFNLAFVASPAQRVRLRDSVGLTYALMRFVKRMMGFTRNDLAKKALFDEIVQRCLATLTLLNHDGHGGPSNDAAEAHGAWFGASRSGVADEEGVEGEEGAPKVETDAPPPMFAARSKVELYQMTQVGLDHASHDALLSLYERVPVRKRV